MIVFEIELNGEALGRAGAEDLSVLTAIITAVGKLGPQSQGSVEHETNYHTGLSVGGLTARSNPAEDEHLEWLKRQLGPGDIVTVKIMESPSADSPTSSKPARTEDVFKQQFESAKQFYLENRDKFDGS